MDISQQIHSSDTSALLLGDLDPVTGSRTLYALVRAPDALLTIEIPADPSREARVRRATALPLSPGAMLRIPRPGIGDLLLISATRSSTVDVFDVVQDQVVGEVQRLGDTPYSFAELPGKPNLARAVVSIFGDCRLGLLEVPLDKPWNVSLRGRVGSCLP